MAIFELSALSFLQRAGLALVFVTIGCQASKEPLDPTPTCELTCGPDDDAPNDPIVFLTGTQDQPPDRADLELTDIALSGHRMWMCSALYGLIEYEIPGPCCLTYIRTLRPETDAQIPKCSRVHAQDRFVYISHSGDSAQPGGLLASFDVSADPPRPQFLEQNPERAYGGMDSKENILYVAQYQGGVGVFEIGMDGGLTRLRDVQDGLTNAGTVTVSPDGQWLFVGGQATVTRFNLADPRDPRRADSISAGGTVRDLAVRDTYVYAAVGVGGVDIFEVTNAEGLVSRGTVSTRNSAVGVAVSDDLLAVADMTAAWVFALDDPAAPRRLGHQKTYRANFDGRSTPSHRGRILDVALAKDILYLAEWRGAQAHQVFPDRAASDLWTPSYAFTVNATVGATGTRPLTVSNLGEMPLRIDTIEAPLPLTISTPQDEIAPGEDAALQVTFTPTDDLPVNLPIQITSNDPDEPQIRLEMRGNELGLRSGQLAPDFRYTSLDGTERSLSETRGSVTLLVFFASLCPCARAELPDVQQLWASYREQGLVVWGIGFRNTERAPDMRRVEQEFGLDFDLLLDENDSFGNLEGVLDEGRLSLTFYVLIDRQGRLVGAYGHYDPLIESQVERLLAD